MPASPTAALDRYVPIGTIFPFAGSVEPNSSWLICDGRVVNKSNYRELYDAIKETWGKGPNSGDFRIPDLIGNYMRGAKKEEASDPGKRYGSIEVNITSDPITLNQIPSHTHPINDPGHDHREVYNPAVANTVPHVLSKSGAGGNVYCLNPDLPQGGSLYMHSGTNANTVGAEIYVPKVGTNIAILSNPSSGDNLVVKTDPQTTTDVLEPKHARLVFIIRVK